MPAGYIHPLYILPFDHRMSFVSGPSRFMFELLVPATPQQLEALGGDAQAYDRKVRPSLMLRAISELRLARQEDHS